MAGGVFLIDQATKAWAIRRLRFGGDRQIIPNFLNFAYAENTGVAFSFLNDGWKSPASRVAAVIQKAEGNACIFGVGKI